MPSNAHRAVAELQKERRALRRSRRQVCVVLVSIVMLVGACDETGLLDYVPRESRCEYAYRVNTRGSAMRPIDSDAGAVVSHEDAPTWRGV
jgi:hypothetical protein